MFVCSCGECETWREHWTLHLSEIPDPSTFMNKKQSAGNMQHCFCMMNGLFCDQGSSWSGGRCGKIRQTHALTYCTAHLWSQIDMSFQHDKLQLWHTWWATASIQLQHGWDVWTCIHQAESLQLIIKKWGCLRSVGLVFCTVHFRKKKNSVQPLEWFNLFHTIFKSYHFTSNELCLIVAVNIPQSYDCN